MRFLKYLWFLAFGRTDTGLFVYWTGKRWRAVDPIVVWRAIDQDPEFNPERHLPAIDRGDVEALGVAAAAVRRIFGIPAFEAGGLPERPCVDLLDQYYAYVASLKKSTETPPTSPPAMERPDLDESTTPPAADCSSTSTGPNCDMPPASSAA